MATEPEMFFVAGVLLLVLIAAFCKTWCKKPEEQVNVVAERPIIPEPATETPPVVEDVVPTATEVPAALTPEEIDEITKQALDKIVEYCMPEPQVVITLPISCAEFETLFASPSATFPMRSFHLQNGEVENMTESPWDGTAPSPGSQVLLFRKKIPFVGPFKKWATLELSYRVLDSPSSGGRCFSLQSRGTVSGVPYSDHFTVYEVWCCLPTVNPYASLLRVHLGITFHKTSPLRSLIQNQTEKDQKAAIILWRQLASPYMAAVASNRKTASVLPSVRPSPRPSPTVSPSPATAEKADSDSPEAFPSDTPQQCMCCEPSCKLGGFCKRCVDTYEESVAHPSPAPDAKPYYTPCTSLGGCSACGCRPLCHICGCRCSLCGQFGSGAACNTVGCASCKCKPKCSTCGCSCGLCGNKGALAACNTVGCAACKCAPNWAPWGKKIRASDLKKEQ